MVLRKHKRSEKQNSECLIKMQGLNNKEAFAIAEDKTTVHKMYIDKS